MIPERMLKKLHRILPLIVVLAAFSAPAMAEEGDLPDARVTLGYGQNANQPEKPATALAVLTLAGLGIVCLGPLFLNAKRTHLD